MTHELWATLNKRMIEYLDSVSLQDLVEQQRGREHQAPTRQISVLREHKAALELPTSTLQPIDADGTRVNS
jgi:Rrf2 family iron-sulfur cluster assembly transcriptional regulator